MLSATIVIAGDIREKAVPPPVEQRLLAYPEVRRGIQR